MKLFSSVFWDNVVNTTYYVINKVLISYIIKKTLYKLYKDRKPKIRHLRVFKCEYFVLNNDK